MTALAGDKWLRYNRGDERALGADGSATYDFYKGAALTWDTTGYIRPGANTAGFRFAGFSLEKVQVTNTTTADGDTLVKAVRRGLAIMTFSSIAVTDIGRPVWLTDDTTGSLTRTNVGPIGKVAEYVSSTTALIEFNADAGGAQFLSVDYGTGAFASNSTTKEQATGLGTVTAAFITNQAGAAPTKVMGSDNTVTSGAVTVTRETSGTAQINYNFLFIGY